MSNGNYHFFKILANYLKRDREKRNPFNVKFFSNDWIWPSVETLSGVTAAGCDDHRSRPVPLRPITDRAPHIINILTDARRVDVMAC